MLKRTASAVERIVMALFAPLSPSRSPNPSRLRWSPSPSPSPSRLRWSPNRSPSPSPSRSRSRSQLWPKLNPRLWSRSPSRPSRRGSLPLVGECLPAPVQQNRRLGPLPMRRQRRRDPRRGQRPTRRLFSPRLLLEPALRSLTRASRFRRPPAVRLRPLRASRFRRPPAEVGGDRRRALEEVPAVQCDRRLAPRGQGSARQGDLPRP